MTDLDKLIAAVEAGNKDAVDDACRDLYKAKLDNGDHWPGYDAMKAYKGSLHAAKRLHDALLPGWGWMIGDKGTVTVIPPERLFAETGLIGPACRVDDNPARAWLLAILRAVRATQVGSGS